MNMMRFADKQENTEEYCAAWLNDGKSFVIRDADAFTRQVIPHFFKATKFSSFTRKLYRWGFRQVNRGIGPDDPIIFGNEYFQRDNADLMVKMRSITAGNIPISSQKKRRSSGPQEDDDDAYEPRKRLFSDHHHSLDMGNVKHGGLAQTPLELNLSSTLRPKFAILQQMQQHQEQQKRLSLQLSNLQSMQLQQQRQQQQQQMNLFLPQQQMHMQMQQQMNMFLPQHQMHQQQHHLAPQFPTASTAEIVNAAINALRYAA